MPKTKVCVVGKRVWALPMMQLVLSIPMRPRFVRHSDNQLTIHSLMLESPQLPGGSVGIQLDQPGQLEELAKSPLQITEGIEYSVVIKFSYVPPTYPVLAAKCSRDSSTSRSSSARVCPSTVWKK